MKWTPKPYQLEAVKFLLTHPQSGIFLDPGMGKTSTVLATFSHLYRARAARTMLIIVPIRPMYKVWPDEIKKWDEFNFLTHVILHGGDKDKRINEVAQVYLINPEGLKWLIESGGLAKINPDVLVIDESTKFKDYSTARFKLIKPLLRTFARRWILTGEPAPNGYMDLFGQMYIVDQGQSLGKFITHYRAQFFYPAGFGGYDWKLRQGADKEIQELIKPKVMRLAAEDHLDMPEPIFDDIKVDLDEASRRIYKQFEEDFLAEVGDTFVMSPNAAAVGSKLRQVANGGVYDENHFHHQIHEAKTKALYDLVEQLQGKAILVGYEFQHDLTRLQRVFPNAPILTGLSGSKLDAVIDGFNAGTVPVLLTQFQSGSHGLNLQESCYHVACYGLPWDLDVYHQFYKRVWRQGQPSNRVFIHRFVADKTIDQHVVKTLYGKDATQKDFLNAIKTRSEE